ncbi:MAG: short-chain dehydrogenase [Paenibacillus sp.]|jgi:NAD(P)-dependent dehydrogenase (short-subunit alcohol dehydrogenase family)|nr:short-chain dehydrogenase [Paenibacillus sp.]
MERIALITGTSSGFGMLTAVKLARLGFRVVATMRNTGAQRELLAKAEQAGAAANVEVLPLDVTDFAAIERVVSEVIARYGRIDVLVNNAGFAIGGFVEELTIDDWREQMETNFFGLVALTRAVLPIMRVQQSGAIVNVSSVSGLAGFPGYAAYAASKFAVEGFSESLRHEMLPFGVKVVLVEPGAYKTPIWGKGLARIRVRPDSPYGDKLQAVMRYSQQTAASAPDPQQVADRIGEVATAASPKLRYPLGRGSRLLLWGKALLPWKWFEAVIRKAL